MSAVEQVEFVLSGYTDADGVRLETGFGPGRGAEFARAADGWRLTWPRPPIDRLEYQFTVRHQGWTEWITDPDNPRTVPNPFGAKSELVFPEYRPPAWLGHELTGTLSDVVDVGGAEDLGVAIPTRVWVAPGLQVQDDAPLLLAHDGSDLAERGGLLRWASSLERPLRVALLDPAPGLRETWYSGNGDYSMALGRSVIPTLRSLNHTSKVIGLGVSLGAVAMLEATWWDDLDALVLQSGSFFTPDLDDQERGFPFFDRICRLTAAPQLPALPVIMTCGTVEENRANNERMAGLLAAAGCPVDLRLIRDAHTLTCWRDAWSPSVDRLLAAL